MTILKKEVRRAVGKGFQVIVDTDIPYAILNRYYDEFTKEQEQMLCTKLAQLAKLCPGIVIRIWCGEGQVKRLKKYLRDLKFVVPNTPYIWVYPRGYLKVF